MNATTGTVITVTGPINASDLGVTLPHEHVIVDFAGGEGKAGERYDRAEVVRTMKPLLQSLVEEHGVRSFVDCTPRYLARDVHVLLQLSRETGLNIITNTGLYMDPLLPESAYELSAEELAAEWIFESREGIEDTNVQPGFIKTAVPAGELGDVHEKLIRAAAIAAADTGLLIATHTQYADRAHEILDILEEEKIAPERWIFVHAQNEPSEQKLLSVARRGCWVELDGIAPDSVQYHIDRLRALLGDGHADRLLLSHDAGWYEVGNEPGAEKRSYSTLFDTLIPQAEEQGIDRSVLRQIVSENPGKAFALAS